MLIRIDSAQQLVSIIESGMSGFRHQTPADRPKKAALCGSAELADLLASAVGLTTWIGGEPVVARE